ncbi:hypothetical protein L2E82_01600 [Cichorium intybus]|uniref:Uncharacterized protein n=1 Tax=Cichorium intybus TaxID=13427 RepID=A0ACB9GZR7_CICIN|nr:hypothetical protein L2E82_01600 [Cichorium intybus]
MSTPPLHRSTSRIIRRRRRGKSEENASGPIGTIRLPICTKGSYATNSLSGLNNLLHSLFFRSYMKKKYASEVWFQEKFSSQ